MLIPKPAERIYLSNIVDYNQVSPLYNKIEMLRSFDASVINLKNKSSQNYCILQNFEKTKLPPPKKI